LLLVILHVPSFLTHPGSAMFKCSERQYKRLVIHSLITCMSHICSLVLGLSSSPIYICSGAVRGFYLVMDEISIPACERRMQFPRRATHAHIARHVNDGGDRGDRPRMCHVCVICAWVPVVLRRHSCAMTPPQRLGLVNAARPRLIGCRSRDPLYCAHECRLRHAHFPFSSVSKPSDGGVSPREKALVNLINLLAQELSNQARRELRGRGFAQER